MRDVLEFVLQHIIDHPESLKIEEEREEDIIRFNVTLADEDYPRVIGKSGLTIKGITEIVRLVENKNNPDTFHKIFINITSAA
jgi:uncharacterized protein